MGTPATAIPFVQRYMPPALANELTRQINNGADAKKLLACGVSVPLANELASQITLGASEPVNAVQRLMAVGLPGAQAQCVVDSIAAATA